MADVQTIAAENKPKVDNASIYAAMTDLELMARIVELKSGITQIGSQIEEWNNGAREADKAWRTRAMLAMNSRRRNLALCKAEATRRNAQRERVGKPGERARAFYRAAKMVLTSDQIRDIWDIAQTAEPGAFTDASEIGG